MDLGLISVALAIVSFGSWGAPMKLKFVQNAKVDHVVFQFYSCIVVVFAGLLPLMWSDFVFSWWGVPGAVMWIISQHFAVNSISRIGLVITVSVVNSTTIVCSFLWGLMVFGEQPTNILFSVLGVVGVVLGIVIVSNVNSDYADRVATILGCRHCVPDKTLIAVPSHDIELAESSEHFASMDALQEVAKKSTTEEQGGKFNFVIGLGYCIACGFLNGCLMVPATMFAREVEYQKELLMANNPNAYVPVTTELSYLISFGIGTAIVAPLILLTYQLYQNRWPEFKFRVVAIPAFATGFLWFIGNAGAVYSTAILGNTVGYPLTQTCLLVSGLWSIVVFHEVRGFGIVVFIVGASVVLGGAALIALFGNGGNIELEEAGPL